jgi:hypothetical protein
MMNLKFLMWMVSPKENPPHVKRSPSAAMVIADEGTIETFRGKTRCKSPLLGRQMSVFFELARYRVVKITRSCFEVALWTTKYTIVYPGSGPSLEVIAPL